ncbi:MAG: hypothetical protein NVS1B16_05150 [Pseudarthrobacter sp.]
MGWLDRKHSIAPPGFNRWLVPPAALAVHLCIGQAYATSVYKTALVKHFGVSLTEIGVIFSIAIVMLGLSAAIMGTWVDPGPARPRHRHGHHGLRRWRADRQPGFHRPAQAV